MSSLTLAFATPKASAAADLRQRLGWVGRYLPLLAALAVFLVIVLFGDALGPYDPLKPAMSERLQGPSSARRSVR